MQTSGTKNYDWLETYSEREESNTEQPLSKTASFAPKGEMASIDPLSSGYASNHPAERNMQSSD